MAADDEPSAELEFKKNLVRQRFGHRLDPAQWQEVEAAVGGIHKMVEALKAVKLDNSDEPFVTFVPHRRKD